MSYLSIFFAAFVLVLIFLYYLLPKKVRGILLLCASLFFYACFSWKYLIFLLFVALTTYFSARALSSCAGKKRILACCIGANVIVWFVIKELPWALHTLGRVLSLLGLQVLEPTWSVLVPVGISYYILQAIGYLVDVYRSKVEPEKSFWKYLLFLSYFPAIVQGPISRYDRLMPQLLNKEKFSFENIRNGLILILFGLVKKMVIADRMGLFVNACFNEYANFHGVLLYIAAVFYSLQLYLDFSGCVDICRGVSGLFGIDLTHNFSRPYLSGSIKEFWGGWHMSLSSWLKDYVYIPLGGNRKGKWRKYLNLLGTFFVSGLWHGAGFNFIFWGLLHAVYQIMGDVLLNVRLKVKRAIGIEPGSFSDKLYKKLITFHLVAFAWIFFRADGLMNGVRYVCNMFSQADLWVLFDGSLFKHGVSQNFFILIIVHIVVLLLAELRWTKQEEVVEGLKSQHIILRWIVYLVLIFDVLLFGVYGSGYSISSFMYGGF